VDDKVAYEMADKLFPKKAPPPIPPTTKEVASNVAYEMADKLTSPSKSEWAPPETATPSASEPSPEPSAPEPKASALESPSPMFTDIAKVHGPAGISWLGDVGETPPDVHAPTKISGGASAAKATSSADKPPVVAAEFKADETGAAPAAPVSNTSPSTKRHNVRQGGRFAKKTVAETEEYLLRELRSLLETEGTSLTVGGSDGMGIPSDGAETREDSSVATTVKQEPTISSEKENIDQVQANTGGINNESFENAFERLMEEILFEDAANFPGLSHPYFKNLMNEFGLSDRNVSWLHDYGQEHVDAARDPSGDLAKQLQVKSSEKKMGAITKQAEIRSKLATQARNPEQSAAFERGHQQNKAEGVFISSEVKPGKGPSSS
jgi:hypothetical protein